MKFLQLRDEHRDLINTDLADSRQIDNRLTRITGLTTLSVREGEPPERIDQTDVTSGDTGLTRNLSGQDNIPVEHLLDGRPAPERSARTGRSP